MSCTSSLVGHDALGRRDDGDTQAAEHAGQLIGAHVNTETGLGHTAETGDDLLLAGVVLQRDVDHALQAVVLHGEALDVALIQQDLSNALLHVGSGDIHGFMLGVVCVADAGQHIRNRIGDMHGLFLLFIELRSMTASAARYHGQWSSPLARGAQLVMTFRHPY